MGLLLGIDVGTSSAKAVLFDPEKASVVATAGHEYPVLKPSPERAEQNPDDWWNAAVHVTRAVLNDAGRDDVDGIGLSGQMHGTVMLDRANKPLVPAIIWADQRSGREVESLIEIIGADTYTAITGTMPSAGFMSATLHWLARYDPKLLRKIRCVILPKDYVRLQMVGEAATDVSDAAATGLFDIAIKAWSPEIVRGAGLPRTIFPTVLESGQIAGRLGAVAAEQLGLRAGIVVAAGSADQPAQAIANGLVVPGRASVTVGSGGQVFTPVRPNLDEGHHAIATDPRLHVFNHALPNTWYVLGAILAGGLSLRWLRGIVGLSGEPDAYALLSAEAAKIPPGAAGLIFLPYLNGERTPHMDARARGAFIGLTSYHERGHLARAIMEGVAFAMRQALDLSLALGGAADTVIANGGAMESDVWRGIMADVLGLPLQRSLLVEQAGVGAAVLGGVAAGVYPDVETASARTACYGAMTEPDMRNHAIYDVLYAQFTGLYPTLKADFHRLGEYAAN